MHRGQPMLEMDPLALVRESSRLDMPRWTFS